MSETIVLDAASIAVNRTALDITSWVAGAGPDWGDAELEAYKASLKIGEVRLEYRLPNRLIKIPLMLRAQGATTFATIRSQIQAKVALMQRESGWLMRQVGSTPLYADIQSITLHLGGSWLQAYRDVDVDAVLAIECLPDWYGDEITLSNHVEVTLPHLFFVEPSILGNHPGRVRVIVSNDGTVDEHGLLWGFRCKNYNAGTTAALFYEAEALTPVNGAAGTALAGASGGSAVVISSLPANVWVSMLSTNMVSGTVPLTHAGSYRVWARCYSAAATPKFQLLYGVGSLSAAKTNDPVQLPSAGAFYLLDLGEARLDAPPVGPAQWFGAIQTQVPGANQSVAIDCVYLQPLDEGAGKLSAVQAAPPSSVVDGPRMGAGTVVNDASFGTATWAGYGGGATLVQALANFYPSESPAIYAGAYGGGGGGGPTSEYLKATAWGFAIPTGATIIGLAVRVHKVAQYTLGTRDARVRLVKAGAVQTVDKADTSTFWPDLFGGWIWTTYGGATDTWGGGWVPADINNAGFGVAFAASMVNTFDIALVDTITITVYYTLGSGFTIAPDAVIAASKLVELRTEGMFRQGAGGTIYAPVSQVIGDLPRIPPSGLEARPVQVFLKPSRGEFNQEPDSGIDDISAKITYRPSFLITP